MTRALCHFDNAYWLPHVAMHGYSAQDQHAEQHRVPRLRRAAGRDRDRGHPRRDRARARQGSAATCGAPTSTAPTERNVTPYGQTIDDNVIHAWSTSWSKSSDYRARREADRRVQRREPGAQARARADAGEVRHLVQPGAPQPGRRAGARLHRRLDPGQPRRHRDGPGPEHQGGAGGGARARRAAARACAAPPPTRRRWPTPRPPRHRPAPT